MDGQIVLQDYPSGEWLLFTPLGKRSIWRPRQVPAGLEEAEREVEAQGCFAVVLLAFECASGFDSAFPVRPAGLLPAGHVIFCDPPRRVGWEEVKAEDAPVRLHWEPALDRDAYRRKVGEVQRAIAEGEAYQVNLTFPLRTRFSGSPRHLFAAMAQAQQASCCAFVEEREWAVCSASPELFLWRHGQRVLTRPMKGTAARGRTSGEDQRQSEWLLASEKNRAENLMIVDMMRNDLGRVAQTGSVEVEELFRSERYPTLWQMTSSVSARTRASTAQLLSAAFPPASITGAPKVAACRLIDRLEDHNRGIYTGCIGYLGPGRRAQFNVAIRTVTIDRLSGQAVYGVGSGIVADSDADSEYRECLLKAEVLTKERPDFELLETLLWRRGKVFLLQEHLDRMADSARYFGYPMRRREVVDVLRETCRQLPDAPHRLRLLLDRRGSAHCQASPLAAREIKRPLRIALARHPVDEDDPFLFHKTTCRQVYQRALQAHPQCDDVILFNRRGELTESAKGNLLVRRGGVWMTPPVECGLLAGTMRERLLARGAIRQGVLRVQDLPADDGDLRIINSVGGILRVERVPPNLNRTLGKAVDGPGGWEASLERAAGRGTP
ncbi:MAG TPA: aminodeoxychorismate synthase component I [Acidobacteriota bacterium]|nr:aminodeoxychorismate synthase component I [Acidobacteriota bacterium]